MLTSDFEVVTGVVYELVLSSRGQEPIELRLDAAHMRELIEAWRYVESREGHTVDFATFLQEGCVRVLSAMNRKRD